MKIYRIAEYSVLGNGVERVVQAYHGSPILFDKFDIDSSAQGVLWFSEDFSIIKNEESGAVSNNYIYVVDLNVQKTAGWEEYDKSYLQQLADEGFDSIKLDNDWAIFDPNRVTIKNIFKRMDNGDYEEN